MTEQLGIALKALRQTAGMSLVEMARRTDIARSHLYRLENGEISNPTGHTLRAIADALGVEPERLFEVAWETTGSGPGLPSLKTFVCSKYGFDEPSADRLQAEVLALIEDRASMQPRSKP